MQERIAAQDRASKKVKAQNFAKAQFRFLTLSLPLAFQSPTMLPHSQSLEAQLESARRASDGARLEVKTILDKIHDSDSFAAELGTTPTERRDYSAVSPLVKASINYGIRRAKQDCLQLMNNSQNYHHSSFDLVTIRARHEVAERETVTVAEQHDREVRMNGSRRIRGKLVQLIRGELSSETDTFCSPFQTSRGWYRLTLSGEQLRKNIVARLNRCDYADVSVGEVCSRERIEHHTDFCRPATEREVYERNQWDPQGRLRGEPTQVLEDPDSPRKFSFVPGQQDEIQ